MRSDEVKFTFCEPPKDDLLATAIAIISGRDARVVSIMGTPKDKIYFHDNETEAYNTALEYATKRLRMSMPFLKEAAQ